MTNNEHDDGRPGAIMLTHGHNSKGEAVMMLHFCGVIYVLTTPAALRLAEHICQWAQSPCSEDKAPGKPGTCNHQTPAQQAAIASQCDLFGNGKKAGLS